MERRADRTILVANVERAMPSAVGSALVQASRPTHARACSTAGPISWFCSSTPSGRSRFSRRSNDAEWLSTRSNLKSASFADTDAPIARLYFNQASPSAYVRGHERAVPFALAFMRALERQGARVLNGSSVFALELSKSAQAALLRTLGVATPRTIAFSDVSAIRKRTDIRWPALLRPEQSGSGARIEVIESVDHLAAS